MSKLDDTIMGLLLVALGVGNWLWYMQYHIRLIPYILTDPEIFKKTNTVFDIWQQHFRDTDTKKTLTTNDVEARFKALYPNVSPLPIPENLNGNLFSPNL